MRDSEGVAAAGLDSPEGLRAFYREAFPAVYSYFFQRCGGRRAIAEDLAQETFLAAASQIRKGKAGDAPRPWILGIARHHLIDHYKREEREQRKLSLAWESERMEEEAFAGMELSREDARAALGRVPPAQRAALALRYLDDMSVSEVARAIGRSLHATESLLARGRESFKRAYSEVGDA